MNVRNITRGAACMILLSVLVATAWGQAPKARIKVVAENATVRIKPDAAGDVIASLPVGSVFEVENKAGEWYEIKYRTGLGLLVTGYIQARFVELENAPEAKPSLPPAKAQTPATTLLKVKVPVASVRAKPDLNAPIIKQVMLDEQLESRQRIGDMYEVIITDEKGMAISGYINSSLVDVIRPGGAVSAAPEAKPSLRPAEAKKPSAPVEAAKPAEKRADLRFALKVTGLAAFRPAYDYKIQEYGSPSVPVYSDEDSALASVAAGFGFELDLFLKKTIELTAGLDLFFAKTTGYASETGFDSAGNTIWSWGWATSPGQKIVAVDLGCNYHLPLGKNFGPYFGAGVSYILAKVKLADMDEINANTLGAFGRVGACLDLGPRMALFLEGKYVMAKVAVDHPFLYASVDINLGGLSVRAGARFGF